MSDVAPVASAATEPAHLQDYRQDYRFGFHGTGGSFFLIFLKNILLTIVTLGIYLAWAKTERRQYVWNNFSFHDQHFRYTGTGLELFKGYLVVGAAYMTFLGIPALIEQVSPTGANVARVAMVIGVLCAFPFLIFRSRAFLYNRTVWRGIRFGLAPNSGEYAKIYGVGILLTILSFGLYSSIMTNRLHRVLTDSTRFGSLEFRYSGSDREVFWMAIKGFFLSILTFGIYYFWYAAKLTRYRFEHTHVGDGASMHCELTGGDLFGLYLLAAFATPLSLGLAFPWITMYSIRLVASRLSVVGAIDFEGIEQRARDAGATADGFADVLDIDIGF